MKALVPSTPSSPPAQAPEFCSAPFALDAPGAREVFLAGQFNGWDFRKTPMQRGDDGVWRVCLRLAPGFYHHKFVVDGRWVSGPEGCGDRHCDRGCERCVPNLCGSMDRVAIVG